MPRDHAHVDAGVRARLAGGVPELPVEPHLSPRAALATP